MCFHMQTFRIFSKGLERYSVDLGKCCMLVLKEIDSLEFIKRYIGSISSDKQYTSLT